MLHIAWFGGHGIVGCKMSVGQKEVPCRVAFILVLLFSSSVVALVEIFRYGNDLWIWNNPTLSEFILSLSTNEVAEVCSTMYSTVVDSRRDLRPSVTAPWRSVECEIQNEPREHTAQKGYSRSTSHSFPNKKKTVILLLVRVLVESKTWTLHRGIRRGIER